MAGYDQVNIFSVKSDSCIISDLVDEGDNHCINYGRTRVGYDEIDEQHPDIDQWLLEIDGLSLGTVKALDIPVHIPTGYVPVIPANSGKLLGHYQPNWIAVRLSDVVSAATLEVIPNLKKFKVSDATKLILLCYAKDKLLEDIWPNQHTILPKIAELGFSAVTAINHSVWDEQSHFERALNVKRSLKTFEEMQKYGVPVIPHMYWFGYKSLDAWLQWLQENPCVDTLAICMQTLRKGKDWNRAIEELSYFTQHLSRPMHFYITGASSPHRITQLKKIMPLLTLSNGSPSRLAGAGYKISEDDPRSSEYSTMDRSLIFSENVQVYQRLLALHGQHARLDSILFDTHGDELFNALGHASC